MSKRRGSFQSHDQQSLRCLLLQQVTNVLNNAQTGYIGGGADSTGESGDAA